VTRIGTQTRLPGNVLLAASIWLVAGGAVAEARGAEFLQAFRSSRIQIVAIESGETLQVLHGHRDSVYGLAWLGDSRLASAGKDKHLLTWNLKRPTPAPRVLYAGDHYITALAVDSQAGRLALPLEEHRVGLIRVSDGEVTHRLEGHTAPVQVLAFAANGTRLISAGNDARIFVWNVTWDAERSGR